MQFFAYYLLTYDQFEMIPLLNQKQVPNLDQTQKNILKILHYTLESKYLSYFKYEF